MNKNIFLSWLPLIDSYEHKKLHIGFFRFFLPNLDMVSNLIPQALVVGLQEIIHLNRTQKDEKFGTRYFILSLEKYHILY